ncbi:hypothetical protein R1sor_023174 [Riccia sorocarpa]|uniref:Uncharacterized protein n=1 Tax=Riccia sorocarpa TaxID=122646 RepID=A0ABD3GLZ7_9MARC
MMTVGDSPAMHHVEATYERMRDNPRTIRLGLANDGFSPVGLSRKSYSIWPVMVINYNIPPWLATKKGHMILSLIIPGPKKPSTMDVYGVRAYDSSTRCPREDHWFQLHAICMWTIHDSPGLGFIPGLAVSGTRECPTCGPHLEAQYSTPLRSTYYLGHEKYLPLDHPLRDNCTDPIPPYMSMMDYCVLEARIQAGEIPRVASGLNRLSILLELPYWDGLLIQHLGDAMHEEGNVVKTLLQHIWGKVDTINHRCACVEFGMHPHAWPYTRSNGMEAIPSAEWVLSAHHKRLFIQRIQQLKCPTGYASNFRMAFTHEDTMSSPLNSLADKEDEREVGEVTFGKKTKRKLDSVMLTQAHTFILHNDECMQTWLEEYEREKMSARDRRERYTRTFLDYMRDIISQIGTHGVSLDVKNIVLGPYPMAKSYNTIWSTGRRFRRSDLDLQSTCTKDSGVCASFLQECRASTHDVVVVQGDLPYFGRVEQILKIYFGSTKFRLLYCSWYKVQLAGRSRTVERDETGFTRVNITFTISRSRGRDEPFVFPTQVERCFFVPAPHMPEWAYVIPYVPRSRQIVQERHDIHRSSQEEE